MVLKNVNVSGDGDYKGGLVGQNNGTISNAGVAGFVSGRHEVGGLVGINQGTVKNSYSSGEVQGKGHRVGGLVGRNSGRIMRSYSTANVTANAPKVDKVEERLSTHQFELAGGLGGLVGGNIGSVVGSYATGRVSGNVHRVGGLVGYSIMFHKVGPEIFASYATGNVSSSGRLVGGLAGYNETPISASYSLGSVSGGGTVGGLVGLGGRVFPRDNGHQCPGCAIHQSGITASYWNFQAYGQTATTTLHLDGRFAHFPTAASQTTSELQQTTGYTGIYALWDDLRDSSGASYAWDFGTSLDFPVLRDTGPSVAAQRARLPDAFVPAGPVMSPDELRVASLIDYDRDDDGLIEVYNLEQLDAIRYDVSGSGDPKPKPR